MGTAAQAGKSMYDEYSGNHPTIHSNRFPSWNELTQLQRDEWMRKAGHEPSQPSGLSLDRIEAPTGQPARAWTAQEKLDCAAAMKHIVDREAVTTASTLTQQQGGEQEAGDALDHLIDSLEAVVIDWAAGADKPQPERDRSLEISLGRLIPRLRRAASILMGSKP